jgi:hypothetical protein
MLWRDSVARFNVLLCSISRMRISRLQEKTGVST